MSIGWRNCYAPNGELHQRAIHHASDTEWDSGI